MSVCVCVHMQYLSIYLVFSFQKFDYNILVWISLSISYLEVFVCNCRFWSFAKFEHFPTIISSSISLSVPFVSSLFETQIACVVDIVFDASDPQASPSPSLLFLLDRSGNFCGSFFRFSEFYLFPLHPDVESIH